MLIRTATADDAGRLLEIYSYGPTEMPKNTQQNLRKVFNKFNIRLKINCLEGGNRGIQKTSCR